MKFHWVAGIALWTIISGPAMYGSGPAPAAKKATPAQTVKVEHNGKTTTVPVCSSDRRDFSDDGESRSEG